MAGWIEKQADGARAAGKIEGESGYDCSTKLLHLLAAFHDVRHLHIDHAVEAADLAFSTSQRSDRRPTRYNLNRLISALHGDEFPIEELAVELPGLRQIGRGYIEPGDAPRSHIRLGRFGRI